mmetsp:Transcript_3513/g.8954  ORF Transcript_3513/g.8954 Transcript_3513/m.8954 type:complete len:1406 (+) Transcript_3513:103-4320(+)
MKTNNEELSTSTDRFEVEGGDGSWLDQVEDDGVTARPSPTELPHTFKAEEEELAEEDGEVIDFKTSVYEGDVDINVPRSKDQQNNIDSTSKKGKEEQPRAGVMDVFQFGHGPKKWCGLGLGLLCATISGLVYPFMAFLLSTTFQVLSAPTSDEFRDNIRYLAFRFIIVGVIAFSSVMAQIVLLEISADEMTRSLKIQWFDSLIRQDMAFFDLEDISGTAMLVSTAGARYKNGIGRKLGEGVQFFFTFLGGFVYAFYSSWRTSLVLLAVVPFMSASILFFMKTSQNQKKRSNESYAEAGSIVLMAASAIRTVYSLNASQFFIDKYSNATEKAYQAAASRVALLGLANGMVMGSVLFLRSAVLTLYGSYLLYDQVRNEGCDPSGALGDFNIACEPDGQSIIGALIGITLGAAGIPQLSLAIESFTDTRAACYSALCVMERKLESDRDGTLKNSSKKVSCSAMVNSLPEYAIDSSTSEGKSASSLNGEIRFDNVSFSYPSRHESLVLENISLSLKPGQTIGVVGPSGSGKSTIVSLLERFYDVTSGSISIDGINIKDLNVSSLREHIGLVSQEPVLFATSIRNNIRYGCDGASNEQIEKAARLANAHDFILEFPDGYDTLVGERGAQMSGGQKQRIALARVLVKKRKLLLLDEFSSALDSESEMIVQEALDRILKEESNMATLIVAHRLSTVRNADCIVVVCDGVIVETGTHEQLFAKKGLYHKLALAQSTDHQDQDEASSFFADSNPVAHGDITSSASCKSHPQFRFRDVHFSYPTRPEIEVLRGLNLAVKKGETLALVGESGGGKSSIISLMERFYDVDAGSVEFDGLNVKELNVKWLRDQIGIVAQEPVLFDTSIRENILYGCPTASKEDIEEACRRANAHDFITSFPSGYDTNVGEGGSMLSGGQKQRIAIARAILTNHAVLLLDEASASLDSKSERMVQDALDRIMKSKSQTTIVVAHRLSTIRNASRIAVVAGGVIREIGTWDQLMSRQGGHFRKMSQFQSLDGHKKSDNCILAQVRAEADKGLSKGLDNNTGAQEEQNNEISSANESLKVNHSKRARLLAKDDVNFLAIGSIGALFAGMGFPATGVLFAHLVELMFHPVPGCGSVGQSSCDRIADEMQTKSFYISLGFIAILVCTSIGNILLYFGFGTASERMNKRVRDEVFRSLLRQEVAYFDKHNAGSITRQLQDDVATLHAFSGEPIRNLIIAISSLLVGIFVSFFFMWPVALMALAVIPILFFAAKAKTKNLIGAKSDDTSDLKDFENPDVIAIETLQAIRTVASLNIEQIKRKEYLDALRDKHASVVKTACKNGSTGGLAQLCQFWGLALLYWWGGFVLSTYPDTWTFKDFLIAIFALLISIAGTTIGSSGTTDKKVAEEAANRVFALIDKQSEIDPLSETGKEGD